MKEIFTNKDGENFSNLEVKKGVKSLLLDK